MTKEEIRQLKKTGKLKELLGDAYDSEASFLRTNTTLSVNTQPGQSDESDSETGGGKRKGKGKGHDSQRRKSKVAAKDVKAGGKKNGKKGTGEDDSDSDDEEELGLGVKGEEDGDSDCSYRSEVSEGGTRRVVKMKRVRDKDGNVVGYGDPQVVPDEFRSVSGAPDPGYHASFKPDPLGLPGEDGYVDQIPTAREPAWKKERERRRQSRLDGN
ncbi:hypothetical protein BaRGS_00024634 [Batillaria attramentaria]|uniref:Uncharacterized protein n=1 Tax=Batillaria attramentaria TaxID=370345 RepID=A0ABD0KAW9_9CAEN